MVILGQTLAQRFSHHKTPSNKSSSKQIIDLGDAVILLVENYPCQSEDQARAREGYYIINNPCVNKCVAGRTKKQYYVDNKQTKDEYQKKYDDATGEVGGAKTMISDYKKIYALQYISNVSIFLGILNLYAIGNIISRSYVYKYDEL
jgi:hypothetical protein